MQGGRGAGPRSRASAGLLGAQPAAPTPRPAPTQPRRLVEPRLEEDNGIRGLVLRTRRVGAVDSAPRPFHLSILAPSALALGPKWRRGSWQWEAWAGWGLGGLPRGRGGRAWQLNQSNSQGEGRKLGEQGWAPTASLSPAAGPALSVRERDRETE